MKFIGRKQELRNLQELSQQKRPILAVIMGRRRIGKSRLAEEFGKDKVFLPFSGLAPTAHMSAQDQRNAFARKFAELFKLPPLTFLDWSDAFNHLSERLTDKPTVILFDEMSWMGFKDHTFIPKLKAWWDLTLQRYPNVFLIFCGSVSTWIEENILNSTAFFGRISLHINLEELSLPECSEFLKQIGFKGSIYDIAKTLSVTGGVPWYLEQISPHKTADENLKDLCFRKDGLLVNEFDRVFNDLFSDRGIIYKAIVRILSNGMRDREQIRQELDYAKSGSLSHHLKALITSGFVSQHYDWSLKTGKLGKRSLYRLSDNYLRFFIKYIEPNLEKIKANGYRELSLGQLVGWESMIGFQVENMLLKNRHLLLQSLDIPPSDVVADNPYIQRPVARQKGCQIDYLIQTSMNNLFVCEFKFKRREIGFEIIDEVKEKIRRFSRPRGYGVVPVLVHIGGVTESVYNEQYFYRIVDMADILENSG
jgi:AAA+ ATPase superfamily predicted ATPase